MYEGKRVSIVYMLRVRVYKILQNWLRTRTLYLFIHTLGGVVVIMVVVIFT